MSELQEWQFFFPKEVSSCLTGPVLAHACHLAITAKGYSRRQSKAFKARITGQGRSIILWNSYILQNCQSTLSVLPCYIPRWYYRPTHD